MAEIAEVGGAGSGVHEGVALIAGAEVISVPVAGARPPGAAGPSAPPAGGGGESGDDGEEGYDDGGASPPPPPDGDGIDWDGIRACAEQPQNDIGNSRRLRHWHGQDLVHIQNSGWFVWDGKRWAEDVDDAHSRPMAHRTAELLVHEHHVIEPTPIERARLDAAETAAAALEAMSDEDLKTAEGKVRASAFKAAVSDGEAVETAVRSRKSGRRKFANSSGNSGKLDAMLRELAAYLSRPLDALDAEPLAFNTLTGTLRFRREADLENPDETGERWLWTVTPEPHRREDLISKVAPVDYDPEASAPRFLAFIEEILPNPEIRAFVQRYFGYGMIGWAREQCFVIFHGEGRNGKSTLVDIVCRILGEYTTSLPIATLVGNDAAKRGAEATPDLARLPGARLVRSAEPKEGLALNEEVIKMITSSEPIPMRRLHREFVDIYPQFSLVISVNRKPPVHGNDDGIWRRVMLVPFDVQIPLDRLDRMLPDRLWEERTGILNWLLAGACDYLARGRLDPPGEVMQATQEYRDESDTMGAWARDALKVTHDPGDTCSPGELYRSFAAWCERTAQTVFRESTFTRRLPKTAARLGIEKGKASTVVYTGLVIRDAFRGRSPPGPSHTPPP